MGRQAWPERSDADRGSPARRAGRARRARRQVLIAVGIALALVVLTLVPVAVGMAWLVESKKAANRAAAAVDRASAGREGEVWGLGELFSYLKAKGGVSAMRVVESGADSLPPEWVMVNGAKEEVRVTRMADAGAARAAAAASPRKTDFAWGRFYVAGNPTMASSLRTHLYD